MPLDINCFREEKGADLKRLRDSQAARFKPDAELEEIFQLDKAWRAAIFALDKARTEKKKIDQAVGAKMKAKENADELKAESKAKSAEIEKLQEAENAALAALKAKVNNVGNFVHESVPVGNDEDKHNLVVTMKGEEKRRMNADGKLLHHHELLWRIGGYEPERGAAVAGHRGYYLTGPAVLLNQALINYGIAFLMGRKSSYVPVQPPFFMKKSIMAETAQLDDFDEQLYKVTGNSDDEDLYLIATSEQPISAYHRGEVLLPQELPKRYAGVSSCFRKEAGAHGRDSWGIFRIHQFEKIEQFCITEPEKSWDMLEEMREIAQEFYESLGFSFRVVSICSGALNNAAAKKYDLEAWFPTLGLYRELVSASNCTDYQSRAMDTRLGQQKKNEAKGEQRQFVHMLNATLCATERTICCVLENYQTETGVTVPEVLRPFMGGMEFIPFVREAPRNLTKERQQAAKEKAAAKGKTDKPAAAPAAEAGAGGN